MKPTRSTTLAAAESKIAALITPELEAKALATLEECLGAEVYVRGGRGSEGIEYKAAPDHAIRLAAAVKIIEFSRGKPATSLVVANLPTGGTGPGGIADLTTLVAKHPDIVRQVLETAVLANARRVNPAAVSPAK